MKQLHGFSGIVLGGAVVLMASQPAVAAPVQVTGVQVQPTTSGVEVMLKTKAGDRPQVFAVNRGNNWTADVTNTRLNLPGGGDFRQENPVPGISLITVTPMDANNVRVTVVGEVGPPVGQITRAKQGGVILSLNTAVMADAPNSAVPPTVPSVAVPSVASQPTTPSVAVPAQPSTPLPPAARPTLAQAAPSTPLPSAAPFPTTQQPLVPNPDVKIQPPPTPPGVPAFLSRPVPPPVGPMSASQIDASPSAIDLGSAERVRLVLRDAPAREVLTLLAKTAGLNLVFTNEAAGMGKPGSQAQGVTAIGDEPKVTLDIENEPVQDVFNYVLRISGLEANRLGRTIFVAPRLPNTARSLVVRSVRLNQVPVPNALSYLVTLGAETAVARDRQVVTAVAIPVADSAQATSAGNQIQTTTEQKIETQRVEYKDSTPILRGLQVSGDERTNMVTLVGDPRKVEIALATLTQLDIRRRQAVFNVRVIDLDLLAIDRASTSFSFGVGDSRLVNTGGVALLNFGNNTPSSTGLSADPNGAAFGSPVPAAPQVGFNFGKGFLLQLQAAIQNGNAKILTDPSLVVQEGQKAQVNVTEEVVTNIQQQITATQNSTTINITVEKAKAGLVLNLNVTRIDDNGFVELSLAPSVSRPSSSVLVALPTNFGSVVQNSIVLLAERRLESGQIRLRDGQTLVLAGVIQEQDRVTVTKVPILGDIPLLGALFRRTERNNQRREVIILVTPRILDDSDRSTYGYNYTPSADAQKLLDQSGSSVSQPGRTLR